MINERPISLEESFKAERNFVLITGTAGERMFARAIDLQNNLDFLDFLFERKLVTEYQKEQIKKMLTSEDQENYTVAAEILNEKSKEVFPTKDTVMKMVNSSDGENREVAKHIINAITNDYELAKVSGV